MKKCSRCKTKKDESEFAVKNKLTGVLHSHCKKCKREIDRNAYRNNATGRATRLRQNALKHIERNRQYVWGIKKNGCCALCPNERRWYVLDFHHKDESNKKHAISDLVKRGCSLKKLIEEIEKCELLCSNCHRELHYLSGEEANLVEASD